MKLLNIHKVGHSVRNSIYIGRSKHATQHFGNPFKVGRDGSRDDVVLKHKLWLNGTHFLSVEPLRRQWILDNLHLLKDKNLLCYCAPLRCHGENYIKLLEGEQFMIAIDPKSREKLEESDLATIELAVTKYLKARKIEAKIKKEIAVLVSEADDLLFPILTMREIDKLKFPGAGTLTFSTDVENHSFDKTVLQTTLLESGVSSDVIAKAMKAADKISSTTPFKITFRVESKKKK